MSKISVKTWMVPLVSILSMLFLIFLGACFYHVAFTTVKMAIWQVEIDGKKMMISSSSVVETRGITPFAAHLEDYQKIYMCNCVVDSDEQIRGGFGGGAGYGSKMFRWRLPSQDGVPFSFRHVNHQTLISQKVTNKLGDITLDWRVTLNGWLSEDGKHYFLQLGRLGGNFYGTDIDYYADYDPDTQRLTLHVRQKLYREPYKRYQFEFELQDNPAPMLISSNNYGESAIPSMFVPVKREGAGVSAE